MRSPGGGVVRPKVVVVVSSVVVASAMLIGLSVPLNNKSVHVVDSSDGVPRILIS